MYVVGELGMFGPRFQRTDTTPRPRPQELGLRELIPVEKRAKKEPTKSFSPKPTPINVNKQWLDGGRHFVKPAARALC